MGDIISFINIMLYHNNALHVVKSVYIELNELGRNSQEMQVDKRNIQR